MNLSAFICFAIAAAARSALMFSGMPGSPPSSAAIEHTTGTRPWSKSSLSTCVLTASMFPTRPSSVRSTGRANSRSASSPDSPTAASPFWLMRETMSRLTCPANTIRVTVAASGLVTRCPSTNSLGMPNLSSIAPICGPPPWTTMGRIPANRKNATSSANDCWSSWEIMALPPYLMTMVAPENFLIHGSASVSVEALICARATRWAGESCVMTSMRCSLRRTGG